VSEEYCSSFDRGELLADWRGLYSAAFGDVRKVALLASRNIVSVGASLSHVHVPGRGPPDPSDSKNNLENEEIEVGMGIHNEPGSHRVHVQLPQLVRIMLEQLLNMKDEDRAFLEFSADNRVVLLVNNLGGLSVLELGGITTEIIGQLKTDYSIEPVRILAGTYMTSLNGLGFSITLMKVVDTGLGQGRNMLELLDEPAEATGWSAAVRTETWMERSTLTRESKVGEFEEIQPSGLKCAQQSNELC
jgi:triose/dihydroxyacetone kinase / FAD-AMP lyase (cyclizing)